MVNHGMGVLLPEPPVGKPLATADSAGIASAANAKQTTMIRIAKRTVCGLLNKA